MASRRPVGAWLLAAFFGAAPVACLFTEEVPEGPCTGKPANFCDDGNPCTKDTCEQDGFCTNEEADLVPDDGNPCTEDKCVEGAAQNINVPDGTECGATGSNLTCSGGKCNCQTTAQCGMSTTCQTVECTTDTKVCKTTNEPDGKVIDGAGDGDCRQNVCQNGQPANVPDTADPPPDPTPGDCQGKSCSDDGKVVNVPNIMDFPADSTAGDCKAPSCSLEGMLVDVDAPEDVPQSDNNVCTTEGCNGGQVINYVPVVDGSPCGAPASCGAAGTGFSQTTAETCQNGVCVPPMTTSCELYACEGDVCGISCAGAGDCIPGAYCSGGLCKPVVGNGNPCMNDGDCASNQCADGVCCNVDCGGLCQTCALPGAVGVCVSIPSGTDPNNECADPLVCNGAGACKNPVGETCQNDSDCIGGQCEDGYCCNSDCPGDCRTCNQTGFFGTCRDVPVGQTSGNCSNGQVCNGAGSCKKINGQSCNGGGDCLSGFCPQEDNVPDVCCDTACNNTCKSCLGARTGGADGTCDDVLVATDPNNDCAGNCNMANGKGCCDGNGVCVPP